MTMKRPRSDVVYGICRGLPSASDEVRIGRGLPSAPLRRQLSFSNAASHPCLLDIAAA